METQPRPTGSGPFDLAGRRVLITGALGGIGTALATLFADQGCRLALTDRYPAVEAMASRFGPGHGGFVADIAREAEIAEAVRGAAAMLGGLDVLINNAGIGLLGAAETFATADWDATMAINTRAPFLFSREAAKHMLRQGKGRIVTIASQAAVIGIEGHLAYCTSKAALLGMTSVMALEWGPKGITANCISPTIVETEMAKIGWSGEKGERARAEIPTRRFAQPTEIAAAALYLASDAAAMVNGANVLIDGGYTIR